MGHFELVRADRSFNNESEAKDVFGSIVKGGKVVCYVPSEQMASFVLAALNGAASVAHCDFLGDFSQSLLADCDDKSGRCDRVAGAIRLCHKINLPRLSSSQVNADKAKD